MEHTSTQPIRVGVHCADALVARGMVSVLAQEPDLQVVPAGEPGAPAVQVRVADLDQAMAQIGAQRSQRSPVAPPGLLVYSPARRERDIRQALAAGIPGFLGQGFDLGELPLAVRTIARGGRYYDAATTQRAAASLASEALTGRELEVLGFVVCGECNKTIAARLDVTVGTVKAHIGAILAKLQVASRTQAVRVAVSRGLVDGSWDAWGAPGHLPRGPQPALARYALS